MRHELSFLGAVALAACATATTPGTEPERSWFVGRWCPDGSSTIHAGVEVVQQPTLFGDDGRYSTFEDNGHWRLDGARLLRQTGANVRYEERVERLGRNRMARTSADGRRTVWRRCAGQP